MKNNIFLIILMGFVLSNSIFCTDLLLIGQNADAVLPVRESLENLKIGYELWSIDKHGAVTGRKVFEYCDDNKAIIRVLRENDTFNDDESIILEDYLSSLGALLLFADKKDDAFYKFPLVKDYILALKDKVAYVKSGDELLPLNTDVFGNRKIAFTEGPVQTTKMLPDAEGVVTNGYTITGQVDSYVSLLVSTCSFRMSFFTFGPGRFKEGADRDYVIKKSLQYVKFLQPGKGFNERQSRIPEPGTVMKDFTMKDLSGVEQSLAKYIGKQGVILSYWADWCSSCHKEMPLLQKHYVADGKVQFMGANFKESPEVIESFKQKYGITFPLIPDIEGKLRRLYRIPTVPVMFFIDKGGVLKYVYRGVIPEDELLHWIDVISQDNPSDVNEEVLIHHIINFEKNGLKKLIER